MLLDDKRRMNGIAAQATDFVRSILFIFIVSLVCGAHLSFAQESPKVLDAIRRGQAFLLKQPLEGAHGSLVAYAVIKSRGDKDSLEIQNVVRQVLQKFKEETYLPGTLHRYEAAVDLMLLEAIDPKLFRSQIEAIANYLMEAQCENGAWYYPDRKDREAGDTSITQYAILGLWAAVRAGIKVPAHVWEKAAKWHIATQRTDGGFAYHPFASAIAPDQLSRLPMTGAGTSSLLIIRLILFPDGDLRSTAGNKRFGVIDRLADDNKLVSTMRPAMIDEALKESLRWIGKNLTVKGADKDAWFTYEWYCMERVGALLGSDEIEKHIWYEVGSNDLLLRQAKDGSWKDLCGPVGSTSLSLLFLSKATQRLFKPSPKMKLLGGGLQAGGRGLPDNLDAVENKDGKISARKIVGSIDTLLSELQRSSDAKVEDFQAAIIDEIQFASKEELIGQTAQLRKLAVDSRPEVRRTAMWALGRSQDISVAPLLIRGLADTDITIVREASFGLSVLARLPEGQGIGIDPTNDSEMGIKPEATDDERQSVLTAWGTASVKKWSEWYLKNRPYNERDDRSSLRKTNN